MINAIYFIFLIFYALLDFLDSERAMLMSAAAFDEGSRPALIYFDISPQSAMASLTRHVKHIKYIYGYITSEYLAGLKPVYTKRGREGA